MRLTIAILLLLLGTVASAADTLNLAGTWRFRMDPHDEGEAARWYTQRLPDSVHLPGSMMQNGKGDRLSVDTKWTASIYDSSWFFDPRMAQYRQPGNLKFPFWLTPPNYYVGAAWYQREITIPAGWQGRHLTLTLERPHSETTVWIDDKPVGRQYGFSTAQCFDLDGLIPGRHRITLRIDNRIKAINVGPDSHSLTDQTQGNWNGVVGQLLLTARPSTWIDDVQVFPNLARRIAHVRILLHSRKPVGAGTITLAAASFNTSIHQHLPAHTYTLSGDSLTIDYPMGDHPLLWDEFDPALYRLTVRLNTGDTRNIEFGMREFRVDGTHFTVNGRRIHLRGMVENCEFPLTGYAPMDEPAWERLFRKARAYGLNHLRFHSYCPPEAAFQAADRVGFYLQPEGPSWANHGTSLGDGKPVDDFLWAEVKRIAKAYGNYASFCMLAYGNEPRGGHQAEWLSRFVDYWKATDNRRVYTGADVGSNWPLIPDNDYMVKSGPRGLNWTGLPESQSDYESVVDKFTVPYVTHEMGQWCAYPDFSEIPRYTGVYKEKNFEIFRDDLAGQGMADEARRFLMASGKLQTLCYKAEIEKSLRTKGSAGFQLLCLTDYSGQGTALVGVLNALWQEKGYVNAQEWSRFCNSTVPLALLPRFVYHNTDTLRAQVEIYHYGQRDLPGAIVDWTLTDDDKNILAKGTITKPIPTGDVTALGEIQVPLNTVKKAAHLRLRIGIRNTTYANDWDCWVYPPQQPVDNAGIYYCRALNDSARHILDNGGKVFCNAAGRIVKGKEVIMNFTPVFWNTSWFKMRPPHTLGILLDPHAPAFAGFPTSYHSNFQWWDILNKAQVMHLEDFPKNFRPLVQPIDTWFLNRRLGLIFEARVGKGSLIVSSADLGPDLPDDRPASRRLYYSIIKYMQSAQFHPRAAIDYGTINALFTTPSKFIWTAHTRAVPDELKPKQADSAISRQRATDSPTDGAIDRHALVQRHNPVNEKADPLGSLSVGNGRFAFTVDITGLQSYPEDYDKGIPLGTQSEWGWHSFSNTNNYKFSETLKPYNIHGRERTYSVQLKNKAVDYFRENPHRLQLGNIGLELQKRNGAPATLADLKDIHQQLILWSGEIKSHFTLEGTPVDVSTLCDPRTDAIAIKINSALLREHRLRIRLRFPYPTNSFADNGDNWTHPEAHSTTIINSTQDQTLFKHQLDTTVYYLQTTHSNATLSQSQPHYFFLLPSASDSFAFTALFTPRAPAAATAPTGYAQIQAQSTQSWRAYWTQSAAVDFTGSTDPRATELERRIILSQYLLRIQDAADYPPQETGLTYNSWYGRPHLEMHWWHEAQFALWNQPQLLERSLDWYFTAADSAKNLARRQGYQGYRWQKMTDPAGREGPSSVGAFLIWQQPHFIYLAELAYRAATDKDAILKKYGPLVDSTAAFMASYAAYDEKTHRYILGPGLIPAQERFKADSTINPAFELAYWRWALGIARQWRSRQDLPPDQNRQRVEAGLAALPQYDSLYYPTESATDAYTNPRYRGDHPVVLATYGFLPETKGLDTAIMHKTFDWVERNWDWETTWGWDYPLVAMTATRLGLPEKAIDALLMPVKKNTYLPDGHNWQDDRLRLYLPGNGGLLAAIALMCAGYDGCTTPNPGIPRNGKWKVKWAGLKPLP
ncbi:sugar-binding domain-containing protein [Puia sp.]|uniref:sugar-binding domain-containing protein n=1 Tax=Puia sp. TaxID=2045100 RepID=UPI002F427F56